MASADGKQHDHSLCMDCFSKLSEFIDNELGETVCSDIKKHLENCSCCSACYATLKKTIDLCGCTEEASVPEDLSARLNRMLSHLSERTG